MQGHVEFIGACHAVLVNPRVDELALIKPVGAQGVGNGHASVAVSARSTKPLHKPSRGKFVLPAYLVSAARTQVDEAAEYAPLRLLTAAGRLAEMIEPNASVDLRGLLSDIRAQVSETSVQAGDPERYTEHIDGLCERTARYLVTSQKLDEAL